MTYSVDPEENKRNPNSPSEYLTMNEQLMYKLASLDAAVQGGFRRLDEKMDRFQSDLHESQIATNDRISELDKEFTAAIAAKRARIDTLVKEGDIVRSGYEKRIVELETWQKVVMAKIGLMVSGVTAAWVLAAPTIRSFLGISNG